MHSTLKTILIFFLASVLLLISYGVNPAGDDPSNRELRAYLNRPVLRLPVSEATAKSSFNYLQRNDFIGSPDIFAVSALVFNINEEKMLLTKNSGARRPIASITKLISSAVVLDNVEFNEMVKISTLAVQSEGDIAQLRAGEVLSVEALLNAALLVSSNDAIMALAEYVTDNNISNISQDQKEEYFVSLMNKKITGLGLSNSYFTDPAGLEDEKSFSTAEDLLIFVRELRKNPKYDALWQILPKEETVFSSQDGVFIHTFKNNNELIDTIEGIIGGKTGYTELAGESLVLVVTSPDKESEIIYIVLGSTDRFGDMRKLINWVNSAYLWEK